MWIPIPWSTCNKINFKIEPTMNRIESNRMYKYFTMEKARWLTPLNIFTEIPKYYLEMLHWNRIVSIFHANIVLLHHINDSFVKEESLSGEDNWRSNCITSNCRYNWIYIINKRTINTHTCITWYVAVVKLNIHRSDNIFYCFQFMHTVVDLFVRTRSV